MTETRELNGAAMADVLRMQQRIGQLEAGLRKVQEELCEAGAILSQVEVLLRTNVPTPRLLADTKSTVLEWLDGFRSPVRELIAKTTPSTTVLEKMKGGRP